VAEKPTKGISRTAKKSRYLKLVVADEVAKVKCIIFNDALDHCEELNNGLPKDGDIVIVSGKKMDGDTIFCSSIAITLNKIYDKLASIGDKGEKQEELTII